MFGFDSGVISGCEEAIQNEFALAPFWHGLVVAAALIGTVFGALAAGGANTYFTHRSENAKADVTELEKFITMLQQRLDESQEELQILLQQIEAGIGKIAELISSATDTSDEIAQKLGQMA